MMVFQAQPIEEPDSKKWMLNGRHPTPGELGSHARIRVSVVGETPKHYRVRFKEQLRLSFNCLGGKESVRLVEIRHRF
jgi:hypothetical protein